MRRREWMRLIGVTGLSMLAGCQGNASEGTTTVEETSTITDTLTKTETTTTTTKETQTESEPKIYSVLPDKRTFSDDEFARTEDLREFSVRYWAYKPELRYIPKGTEEMEFLEPNNEVFLYIEVYMRDLKNENRDFPDPSTFAHKTINTEIGSMEELPEDVEWDQISQRRNDYQFDVIPIPFGEFTDRGVDLDTGDPFWGLLFDTVEPSHSPVLKWEPTSPIGGSKEPIYMIG